MSSDGSISTTSLPPSVGTITLHGRVVSHHCSCERYMYEKGKEARCIFNTLNENGGIHDAQVREVVFDCFTTVHDGCFIERQSGRTGFSAVTADGNLSF